LRFVEGTSMRRLASRLLLQSVSMVVLMAGAAHADVLLDQTNLIGLATVAAPSQNSFTASTAQALTLTLTDFQIPAAFTALQVAVTLGDTLVGSAAIDPSTHVATVAIPAAAGNYTVRVIGTPASAQGAGNFGACVAPAASPTSCIAAYGFSGTIQTPATASSPPSSSLETNFTSTVAGTYTVTITDDGFPVALQSVAGGISSGSTPVNTTSFTLGANQVTLAAGTSYTLLLAALADANIKAGLFGVHIADPNGAAVLDRTQPVGTLAPATIVDNTAAQGLSLSLTDYAYPLPLASLGAVITQGSKSLATLTASGSLTNFAAAAGAVNIWQYAMAGAQPGVYSLNLSVYQSGSATSAASLFSTTQVVNPVGSSTATSYAFVQTLPSAGTYNLAVNDFQFPSAFQSISATVAQNGTVLQQTSSGNFTAAAGPVIVLVNVSPPQSGNGIFGVTVQTSGAAPQILLDQTQAVGGVFSTQSVNLGNSGGYTVTLADLGFPVNFENLAVVVSQSGKVLGKIFGGGTFDFTGTPGTYVLTFVATPATPQDYGLYTVNVASSAPTITFTAGATSVAAGQPVQLTWSTQNATSCTASGSAGWSGNQPISGTSAVVVNASVSLTLTCSGPGGSAAQSLNVSATAAPAKSGGGGGSLDLGLLAALGACVLARRAVGAAKPNSSKS
jgi:hypothetical protein